MEMVKRRIDSEVDMRLIDADALIKYIEDENKQIIAENGKKARDTDAYKMSLVIIEVIKMFNTAYDIDKVVEELELHSFEIGTDTLPAHYVRLNDAIEIVKRVLKEQNEHNSITEALKPRGCADMSKDIVCNCTKEHKIYYRETEDEYEELDIDEHDKQIRADALNEYATILMSVFSHSCEFYFISDDWTIEAIEKEKIDDVILKCLAKVREDKGGNDGNSINN